jgi:hypothetical protein
MKKGMTLQEMAAQLERQANAKKDYIVRGNGIQAVADRDGGARAFGISQEAASALAAVPT